MITREEVVLAAREEKDFIAVVDKHRAKTDTFDLSEVLATLSRGQVEDLWLQLQIKTTTSLVSLESQDDEEEQVTTDFLSAVVTVASMFVQQPAKDRHIPPTLVGTVIVLNGILQAVSDCSPQLASGIAKLCEAWWAHDLPSKMVIGHESLVHLLQSCTTLDKIPVAMVKRVWHLHECLEDINFDNRSSTELKNHLLHTYVSSTFLKSDEGKRFLAYVFTLNANFVKDIHKCVKGQIPLCSKSILTSYSDVYYKAWDMSQDEVCQSIEDNCIQDLMHYAVHAKRNGPNSLPIKLAEFLQYFHKKKLQPVKSMLARLYEPIIWRAFKVANGLVRANAASLLVDAFPLLCNEDGVEARDTYNQLQYDTLTSLLKDPNPTVRIIVIKGVCVICKTYWERIPTAIIQQWMVILAQELAWDVSSPLVRVAVIKGLASMTDTGLCIPLLKTILPEISNMVHDKVEIVRVAFVELIIKVKTLRAIKFWTIVPLDHLLYYLGNDVEPVSRRISSLLLDSYMPLDHSDDVRVSRCVSLLQTNPVAARRFYTCAAQRLLQTNDTVSFMILLGKYVRQCAKTLLARQGNDSQLSASGSDTDTEADRENVNGVDSANEVHDDEMTADDETIALLLETVCILWEASLPDLKKKVNSAHYDRLRGAYRHMLREMMQAFTDPRIYSVLVLIASFLPPNAVPTFSIGAISKLKHLEGDCCEEKFSTIVSALCKWGKGRDLIELLNDWLKPQFKRDDISVLNTGVKRRGVTFAPEVDEQETRGSHGRLALRIIGYLLQHHQCQPILLKSARAELMVLTTTIKSSMTRLDDHMSNGAGHEPSDESSSKENNESFLCDSLSLYCKLLMLLHDKDSEQDTSVDSLSKVIRWSERSLLTRLRQRRRSARRSNSLLNQTKSRRRLMNQADMTLNKTPTEAEITAMNSTLNTTVGVGLGGGSAPTNVTMLDATIYSDLLEDGADKDLVVKIIKLILTTAFNVILIGLPTTSLITQITTFCSKIMNTDNASLFVEDISRVAYQLSELLLVTRKQVMLTATPAASRELMARNLGDEFGDVTIRSGGCQIADEGVEVLSAQVPLLMGQVLQCLEKHTRKQNANLRLLDNIRTSVESTLLTYFRQLDLCDYEEKERDAVMSKILDSILSELKQTLKRDITTEKCETLKDLPPISSLLMRSLKREKHISSWFLTELSKTITSYDKPDIYMIAAVVHTVHAANTAHFPSGLLKECTETINAHLEAEQHDSESLSENSPYRLLVQSTVTLLNDCQKDIGMVV